jgi:hypothetical protein
LVETLALAAKRIDQRTRCECGSSRWECVGCADEEDFQNVSRCRPRGRGGEAVKDLGVVTVEMRRCAHGSCLVNGIKEPTCTCFCHEETALRADVNAAFLRGASWAYEELTGAIIVPASFEEAARRAGEEEK